jgi:hypothetical protein
MYQISKMDLLKHRTEKAIKNQELIKEILDKDLVQRYRFGSLSEMSLIRGLMLDKIMSEKLKTRQDLEKLDKIKEVLQEYFYVETLDQLDHNDYIRYLSFNNNGEFELKNGGQYVNTKDNFIILKVPEKSKDEKPKYWKISDKTPIFCKLNDHDKIILVLLERIN